MIKLFDKYLVEMAKSYFSVNNVKSYIEVIKLILIDNDFQKYLKENEFVGSIELFNHYNKHNRSYLDFYDWTDKNIEKILETLFDEKEWNSEDEGVGLEVYGNYVYWFQYTDEKEFQITSKDPSDVHISNVIGARYIANDAVKFLIEKLDEIKE